MKYPSQGDDIDPHVIQHPLEEAEEVALHFSTSGRLGSSCRGWQGERVLWSSTELPLVVTGNVVIALQHFACSSRFMLAFLALSLPAGRCLSMRISGEVYCMKSRRPCSATTSSELHTLTRSIQSLEHLDSWPKQGVCYRQGEGAPAGETILLGVAAVRVWCSSSCDI